MSKHFDAWLFGYFIEYWEEARCTTIIDNEHSFHTLGNTKFIHDS